MFFWHFSLSVVIWVFPDIPVNQLNCPGKEHWVSFWQALLLTTQPLTMQPKEEPNSSNVTTFSVFLSKPHFYLPAKLIYELLTLINCSVSAHLQAGLLYKAVNFHRWKLIQYHYYLWFTNSVYYPVQLGVNKFYKHVNVSSQCQEEQ